MNAIDVTALIVLIVALAGLISYARHDAFTARRTPARDELGIPRTPRPVG